MNDKNPCFPNSASNASGGLADAIDESHYGGDDADSKARAKLRFFDNSNLQDNLFYQNAEAVGAKIESDSFAHSASPIPHLPIGDQEQLSKFDNCTPAKRSETRDRKHRQRIDSIKRGVKC